MVMQNKNFEEFMDFRDMIQGGSLDDRQKIIKYMSDKPVMARQGGGPAMMEEEDMDVEPVARSKDFLVKAYGDAALAKNPGFFAKFFEEQQELNIGIENTKDMLRSQMGLSSMPVANASLGGFLKDLGINIGKAVVGDVVGAGIGFVADDVIGDSAGNAIGDFFDSSAGRGLTGAVTNAALDYGFSEFLGEGQGPNIGSFGFDFAAGALGDYATRPKDERDFFGFDPDEDETTLKRRIDNAASQGDDTKKLREELANVQGVSRRRKERRDDGDDFLSRLGRYSGVLKPTGIDRELKFSPKGLLKRSIVPIGSAVVSEAERQSAIPTDPNQGQGGLGRPSKFIPDLNRQATRRLPKRDRSTITSEQARQLKTRGFFIDTKTGERVTAQDFIGGISYLPSTQAAKQGGFVSLNEGGQPNSALDTQRKELPIIDLDEDNEDFILSLLFPDRAAKQGGLVNRARGGDFSGMIGGDGHGMEDNVQMPIVSDGEQVATLAVSPKEYVVDAYTMAALGNGNPDEGAKIMDQTIKGIRQRAYGTKKQPNEINGTKALRSGLTSLG